MNSPYQPVIKGLIGEEITIDRHGSTSLKGKLKESGEGGCTLVLRGPTTGSSNSVFVAYEDICGVGHVDWDHNKIDK